MTTMPSSMQDAFAPSPGGHHLFMTALGLMGIGWNERGVSRLVLPGASPADTERALTAARNGFARVECAPDRQVRLDSVLPARVAALVAGIRRWADGAAEDFSHVPLDLRGVPPQRRAIYREARRLQYGDVATYGELGERAGLAEGAREVGQAMAANPVPLIIPCHRVLAAGRKLGGFSAPGGAAAKARLLAMEGVRLGPEAPAQASLPF